MRTGTSAVELLRRARQERSIEDLLFSHPGLIHPELSRPRRQVVLSRNSRADLLFEVGRRVIVVEIKRDVIRPESVRQIERYASALGVPRRRFTGFLIAPVLHPSAGTALGESIYKLHFRSLGRDIPMQINVCRKCRRAYDSRRPSCPDDGETSVL